MEMNAWLILACFICGCIAGVAVALRSRNLLWVGAPLLTVWCMVVLLARHPEWLKTVAISPLTILVGFASFAVLNPSRRFLQIASGLAAYCVASGALAYTQGNVLVFAASLLVPLALGLISFSWYVGIIGLMSAWRHATRRSVSGRVGFLLLVYSILVGVFSRSDVQALAILASMGLPFACCFLGDFRRPLRARR